MSVTRRAVVGLAAVALAIGAVAVPTRLGGGSPEAAAAGLAKGSAPRITNPDPAAAEATVAADQTLALALYRQLAQGDGNVILSPYSIATALTMTLAGARGTTEAELQKVLGVDATSDPHAGRNGLSLALQAPRHADPDDKGDPVVFTDAASLWAQAGFHFRQAFLDELSTNYGAGVRLVDFEHAATTATDQVNAWVADQTKGRIRQLLDKDAVDESTRLVLVNAVYFKGSWAFPFDPSQTADSPFTRSDNKPVTVPFMHTDDELAYARGANYEAVALPYVGGASMVVVLPDRGRMSDVEQTLAPDSLQFERASVDLAMPKFSFSQHESLRDTLAALGVHDAFDADRADFSGMDGERDLSVADVVHEANISVDEKGTTASAATGVVMRVTSAPSTRVKVTLDRPFLFFVQDGTTAEILFMGRVADPAPG